MTGAAAGSVGRRTAPRPRSRPPGASALGRASGFAAALAIAVLALVCAGWITGHRTLVDRSDSMRPALSAGDLVVNRSTPAREITPGDIVTFEDPALGHNITHRVVERRPEGANLAFVTRGDANSGVERWSARPDKRLGRLVTAVPGVGFVLGLVTSPIVRLLLTAVCAVAVCTLVLRWIWRVQ